MEIHKPSLYISLCTVYSLGYFAGQKDWHGTTNYINYICKGTAVFILQAFMHG